MFSGEGEKRSVFVGCKFQMGNLDLRRTVRKVTYKSLTLPPECGSPGNHANPTPTCNWLSQKKIQPTVRNNTHCSVFGFYLTLIRAPLPSWIARTLGTSPYRCSSHAIRSSGSKSLCVGGHLRCFAQGSCARRRRDGTSSFRRFSPSR